MLESIYAERRRPSKVAASLRAEQIARLRQETAETKLLRAFQLYQLGKELGEAQKNDKPASQRQPLPEQS